MCRSGVGTQKSHSLRVACATRLFQSKVDEKLIRDGTGHRSNALFSYEKSSLAQQMNVRNTLAPPDYSGASIDIGKSEGTFVNKPSLSESVQESSSDILKDLELIEFEETADLMRTMISSKPDGSDSGVTNVSMSGSVFNNCTFNFSK